MIDHQLRSDHVAKSTRAPGVDLSGLLIDVSKEGQTRGQRRSDPRADVARLRLGKRIASLSSL